MAKKRKKKSGISIPLLLGIAGAAVVGGAIFFYLRNKALSGFAGVYGGTCNGCVNGLPPSKARAHRWLESQMEYQGEDPLEHQVIDEASGLELGRAGEFAKVLHREYGQAVTYEHIPWNGIGRPE